MTASSAMHFFSATATRPVRTAASPPAFNRLRLVPPAPDIDEDEVDSAAARAAEARWAADGYRTTPADEVWADLGL